MSEELRELSKLVTDITLKSKCIPSCHYQCGDCYLHIYLLSEDFSVVLLCKSDLLPEPCLSGLRFIIPSTLGINLDENCRGNAAADEEMPDFHHCPPIFPCILQVKTSKEKYVKEKFNLNLQNLQCSSIAKTGPNTKVGRRFFVYFKIFRPRMSMPPRLMCP